MNDQQIETQIVNRLIRAALAKGFTISVNDDSACDGEWVVNKSANFAEITKALRSTEGDTLRMHGLDGRPVAVFCLIWGNGEDVISDCSANSIADQLFETATA